jgi:hypothetical protein
MKFENYEPTGSEDLYNIPNYGSLVCVVDRREGFILLKNLVPQSLEEMYSIAAEDEETGAPVMPNPPKQTWVKASNADKIMRSVLGIKKYSKATDDFSEIFG